MMLQSNESEPFFVGNHTIHQHLQTQFNGVITKLSHEIEFIIQLINLDHENNPLEHLKEQLNHAYEAFCTCDTEQLNQCVTQFRDTCQQAIYDYERSQKGYLLLHKNEATRIIMINIFNRFLLQLDAVVNYTQVNPIIEPRRSESTIKEFLCAIRQRFTSVKKPIHPPK